jgi:hypothetical protein
MPIWPVQLRSSLVLVPGLKLQSRLLDFASRTGFPQSPYDIAHDLGALNSEGGVPLILSEPLPGKSDWSVLLHTRRYLVRLFVTKFGDAYTMASVAPLRLRDHQRLAQGYLLTRPPAWSVVDSPQMIPAGSASGWDTLVAGWDQLNASLAATFRPTEKQDAFLRTLGLVIDATERITLAAETGDSYPYREARPTAGSRSGATQAFEFTLAGARIPEQGAFVQVACRAGAGAATVRVRGQVTRVSGMTITIRLDEPADWTDLRGQGEITTTASTVVFRMQREALSQFRTGKARNPGVLRALIDGQADPPWDGQQAIQTPPSPAPDLNRRQREAFDKVLAGPDLVAVIGPPGTGKTTTITEIVRAAAAHGGRVIICSQNNRAVDNVLGRLPEELLAVRVGNEVNVTAEGVPYLLQRQAADLRTQILNKSRRRLGDYEGLGDAEGWAAEFAERNAALTAGRLGEAQALSSLDSARRAAGEPAAEEVDRLTEAHAERELEASHCASRWVRLNQLCEQAAACSRWVIIGWIFGLLSRRWTGKAQAARAQASDLASAVSDAAASLAASRLRLIEVTKDVPAVIAAKTAADTATAQTGRRHAAALDAARSALDAVTPMGLTTTPLTGTDDAELAGAEKWLTAWLPCLAARRDLLSQWIGEASGESDQLYPELLRYANVLASTCTGAGSRPELADLDFDLAIVDEAGQIGMADALIPLARSRHAVLVGDHMQLPPFLEGDVEAWAKLDGDPVVLATLKKSALEMVVDALPQASPNVVWLTEQHRMPEVIAKFASTQFYQGRLETPPGLREHRSNLFGSALAFIDTSALDWPARGDRPVQHRERFPQHGYDNPGEARMLADLAVHYDQASADWGVIVPYLAQAELIRRLLTGRAGDTDKVRLNVGTVDSFQGGERDVILYGFTRSNPERRVGFLSELRRVNVALTRARMQLVLVGDLETLTDAQNLGFRRLARALRDYAAGNGEIISHDTARSRLRAEGQAR